MPSRGTEACPCAAQRHALARACARGAEGGLRLSRAASVSAARPPSSSGHRSRCLQARVSTRRAAAAPTRKQERGRDAKRALL
eukprot:4669496-Pleurochrysis_carterae.AAC.2